MELKVKKTRDATGAKIERLLKKKHEIEQKMMEVLAKKHDTVSKHLELQFKKQQQGNKEPKGKK